MTATPIAALARRPAGAPALAGPGGLFRPGVWRAGVQLVAARAAGRGSPGSPLAVIAASRRDLLLGVLAALRLGRPVLPLDPARPDLSACLAACAPGGVLGEARGDWAGSGAGAALSHPAVPPAGADATTAAPSAPALLLPTSGTTGGAPRIAMLSRAALDAHVRASAAVLPVLEAGGRWLMCLPATSVGAQAALWRVLAAGACLVLPERFDAVQVRDEMARGVSHASVVPAMLAALAGVDAPAPVGLRCLLSGGGELTHAAAGLALERRWPLWNGWGMTETASHVAATAVGPDWQEGHAGRPLPGVALRRDDASGRLAVAGPMLMSGYATPGLAAGTGLCADGSLLTSDLGELDESGGVRVLGRADDVVVTGGVNVQPLAVERVLSQCAGVIEVAVTGLPDERWGRRLVALYAGSAAPADLEAWARARLPSAERPRGFHRVARLPRNGMGKLLRQELAALVPASGG